MSESKYDSSERFSRQQAAELLTDVVYALMTDGALQLGDNRRVTLPATDEVVLKRETRSNDNGFELRLELTWSSARPPL